MFIGLVCLIVYREIDICKLRPYGLYENRSGMFFASSYRRRGGEQKEKGFANTRPILQ